MRRALRADDLGAARVGPARLGRMRGGGKLGSRFFSPGAKVAKGGGKPDDGEHCVGMPDEGKPAAESYAVDARSEAT